jgi:uncharacterized repeat protein (TIGR01451 family)
MKTASTFKPILLLLIVGFLGSMQFSSAQITGLYYWDDSDSAGHVCYNTPINSNVYWSDTGSYVTGDTLDITIDWGDGNIESFPNNIITASFYSYISGINPVHAWTAPGIYYINISANDHYSNTFNYIDSIEIIQYCGFVVGDVLLDDGDGIYEGSWIDLPASGVPLIVTTSLGVYGSNTSSWGHYQVDNIDQAATTYHVEIDPAWLSLNGFTVISPAVGYYDFTTPPLSYTSYNFLLDCGGAYADESVTGYGWGFKPNTDSGFVDLYFHSFSCSGTPADVDLSITFDPILTPTTSTWGSYGVVGNILNATLTGINSYHWERIHFAVPPGTLSGTPIVFNINTNVTNYTDNYLPNNSYTLNSVVLNSWDPNNKSTNVASTIDAAVTDEIYYTIRFQNEGNASATDVTIVDTIDTQFDLNSFRLVAQDHAGSYSIDPVTRIVTFTFPNIMLPQQSLDDLGSQGFVRYKIKENPGLAIGTELNNTAYIYFDSNPAIVTNTTSNINTSLGIEDSNYGSTLKLYPQPANEMFYISGVNTQDITNIRIMDGNGKIVQVMNGNKISEGISVSELASGMYFVSVSTKEITYQQKLIVYH